jgi:hypothetical protein
MYYQRSKEEYVQDERRHDTRQRRRKAKAKKKKKYKIRSINSFKRCISFAFLLASPRGREHQAKTNRHHAKMFRYAFNHSEFIIRRGRRKRRKGLPSQKEKVI